MTDSSSTVMPAVPEGTGKVRTFLDLIKFAHSIFALPFALVAAALAVRSGVERSISQWVGLVGLVIWCMVAARTYAMSVNRLLDRKLDARNPRTARRPSVTGAVSPGFMYGAVGLSASLFLAGAGGFWVFYHNCWPLVLAGPVLLWLGGYSLTKRFTWLCHLWLGVSLGMAPLAAWIAMVPTTEGDGAFLVGRVIWLGVAVVFWVTGFDILYALQDEEIDRAEGLHSIPALFGRAGALGISRGCHVVAALALCAVGFSMQDAGVWYWVGTGIAALLLVIEQALVSVRDISRINVAFMTVNGFVGVVYAGLAIGDIFWR